MAAETKDKAPEKPVVEKEEPKPEFSSKKLLIGVIKNPKKFQTIFEVASYLVDDVVLRINKEGIAIRAIDTGHIGFLLVDMPKTFFSKFRTNEDLSWNVSIVDITKILKRSKATDNLEISHHEEEPEYLTFKIITGKRQRTFKLKQKSQGDAVLSHDEITADEQKLDDILKDFEKKVREASLGTFTLETDFLEDLVKDALVVTDVMDIDIEIAKDILRFSALEITAANVTELSLKEKEHVLSAKVTDDCHGRYSLTYMENVLKMKSVVEAYHMTLAYDGPLLIEGKFIKDEEKLQLGEPGRICYILAPRVETMDEAGIAEAIEKDLDEVQEAENKIKKAKKAAKKNKKPIKATAEETEEALDAEAEDDMDFTPEELASPGGDAE
jgi:DNA polymerase III sliding clamp (beta) subunit (PCNA family)